MIPLADIVEWRKHAPWPLESQVEQDLVLSRALVELFQHDVIAERMAFRGGTAIHKLFVSPPGRYSEDIDVVQVSKGPIGPVMDVIRESLGTWLGEPSTKRGRFLARVVFRFPSTAGAPRSLRLKIEINYGEPFTVLGFTRHPFKVESRWFRGAIDITSYHVEEILGTKLRALYQRMKGRDLFDIWKLLQLPRVSTEKTLKCFLAYIKREGKSISRAQFERNLALKKRDDRFLEDTRPLLASSITWASCSENQLNKYLVTSAGYLCMIQPIRW